jgi:hypothetical protein
VPRKIATFLPRRSFTDVIDDPAGTARYVGACAAFASKILVFRPLARPMTDGRSPCHAKSSWPFGDGLVDRRPGALEEIPFDLDAGLVLECVLHIVPGVGGRRRAPAGKGAVVDADRCKAEPDGEGL